MSEIIAVKISREKNKTKKANSKEIREENYSEKIISKRSGKKNFGKKKNPDLWIRFLKIYRKHSVKFVWIKGHSSIKENEKCDQLAVDAAESNKLKKDVWYENNVANEKGRFSVAYTHLTLPTNRIL